MSETIFNICKQSNVQFHITWLPRRFLSFADRLSRQRDHDGWQITAALFYHLSSLWGPFSIDLFADHANAKTERFYSKFHCPGTGGVNAFLASWEGENSYVVPPVYLVPQTLLHIQFYKVKGVLVVPYWPSAAFFPMLITETEVFQPYVKGFLFFEEGGDYVVQGKNTEVLLVKTF